MDFIRSENRIDQRESPSGTAADLKDTTTVQRPAHLDQLAGFQVALHERTKRAENEEAFPKVEFHDLSYRLIALVHGMGRLAKLLTPAR